MVVGFTIFGLVLLILAGGIEGSSSAKKFMRDLGFMFLSLVL